VLLKKIAGRGIDWTRPERLCISDQPEVDELKAVRGHEK
jgi:hypothetical protein